jgi:hypothetical protein
MRNADRIVLAVVISAGVAVIVGIVLDILGHPGSKVLLGTALAVAAIAQLVALSVIRERSLGRIANTALITAFALFWFSQSSEGITATVLVIASLVVFVPAGIVTAIDMHRKESRRDDALPR